MTRMIMSFGLIVGGMIFFSCDSPDDQVVVDVNVYMTIEDADGNDLLNPATENYIKPESIHILYEIGGNRETYESINQGATLDKPAGFFVSPPEGEFTKYRLTIFTNPTGGDHVVTIIEVEGHEDIILVTEVSRKKGNTIVQKIWYKDALIYPSDKAEPKLVKVVY